MDIEEEIPNWYDQFNDEEELEDFPDLSEEQITSLRIEAQNVLEAETKHYVSKKWSGKRKDKEDWMKTVLSRGTASDKIAALALSVINSPIHNLSALTALVNMVKVSKKRQCIEVMEVLCRLFKENLLKSDVKLKSFDKQPLSLLDRLTQGNGMKRRIRLSAWLFEHRLKELYEQFINCLDSISKDTLDANREKAISTMYELLANHPEQEKILLKNIVNKIGDPNQKVASKVIYCLTQLLREHPNMKQVVLDEVELLLFRSNIAARAQYYAICFLSQFVFSGKDQEVARNVINIYFAFFKASIKKGEIDSRLMGALLMGVKRAFPYAKLNEGSNEVLTQHINTLYKLVHVSAFNISLHTLCLLQQVSSTMEDRFYSALYKKLLDPKLPNSTHHAILINLLYKALIKDANVIRVKAMVKRVLQLCLHLPVALVCGLLFMLSQFLSKKKNALAFETTPVSVDLVVEEDDDGEEKYVDVDKEEEADLNNEEKEDKKPSSWHFRAMFKTKEKKSEAYDPAARNPSFANADKTAYFELLQLTKHFHPSVSLFATKILNSEPIVYSGDPLVDFTLGKFLERFVFKNPKKQEKDDKSGPDPNLAMRKYYNPTGVRSLSVTSTAYLKLNESNVPVEERFLYRYLKEKYGEKGLEKKEEDDDFDDNSSVASEEFDEMLESLVGKSKDKEIDFLEDIGENLRGKRKKDQDEDDDDDDVEESEIEEEEEEEGQNEAEDSMEDLSDLEGDSDAEVMDFSSDEDDAEGDIDIDEAFRETSGKKKKTSVKVDKKRKKKGLDSLFAPAEEFSEILEEAGADSLKPGMAGTLLNTDNAAQKQINWEKSRNQWVQGFADNKRKRPFHKGPKGGRFQTGKKKFKRK